MSSIKFDFFMKYETFDTIVYISVMELNGMRWTQIRTR